MKCVSIEDPHEILADDGVYDLQLGPPLPTKEPDGPGTLTGTCGYGAEHTTVVTLRLSGVDDSVGRAKVVMDLIAKGKTIAGGGLSFRLPAAETAFASAASEATALHRADLAALAVRV